LPTRRSRRDDVEKSALTTLVVKKRSSDDTSWNNIETEADKFALFEMRRDF
jgi:hypothetical protein